MPLLVLLAMPQFILSSALLQIGDRVGLGQLAWLVPARWGFATRVVTIGLTTGPGTFYPFVDPFWEVSAGVWVLDMLALVALTVLYVAAAWWLQSRLEVQRR